MSLQYIENDKRMMGDSLVEILEMPVEVKKFSDEQKEDLKKQAYLFYPLGLSIKTLKYSNRKFMLNCHRDSVACEVLCSMHSEVAIRPDSLFLPNSNRKSLKQEEEMVEEFSVKLSQKTPGVKAVMGNEADYIELAFRHLYATGIRLFGEAYGYNYARAKNPYNKSGVANVGDFGVDMGLHINDWFAGRGNEYTYAVPLVVPA